MAGTSRSNDWGFPRWRSYGGERGATQVRMCDRDGCGKAGDRPAPKSPNSPERWYFCEEHAGEYNRGWNYFEGLSAEEAAAREQAERGTSSGYAGASHYGWADRATAAVPATNCARWRCWGWTRTPMRTR